MSASKWSASGKQPESSQRFWGFRRKPYGRVYESKRSPLSGTTRWLFTHPHLRSLPLGAPFVMYKSRMHFMIGGPPCQTFSGVHSTENQFIKSFLLFAFRLSCHTCDWLSANCVRSQALILYIRIILSDPQGFHESWTSVFFFWLFLRAKRAFGKDRPYV